MSAAAFEELAVALRQHEFPGTTSAPRPVSSDDPPQTQSASINEELIILSATPAQQRANAVSTVPRRVSERILRGEFVDFHELLAYDSGSPRCDSLEVISTADSVFLRPQHGPTPSQTARAPGGLKS